MGESSQARTGPRSPHEQLVLRLREEAARASPLRSAMVLYELGRLYEKQLEQPDRALEAYRQSFRRFPRLLSTLRALTRLLTRSGDSQAIAPLLDLQLELARSNAEQGAIRVERALFRINLQGDLEGAREDLEAALALVPGDPVPLDVLIELLIRTDRPTQLGDLLCREAASSADPLRRSALLARAAQVREQQLQDLDQARVLYRDALASDPANLTALEALLRLAKHAGDLTELAELTGRLARTRQGTDAVELWARAAALWQQQPNGLDQALACLSEAVGQSPEATRRPLLVARARLLLSAERWTEAEAALVAGLEAPGDSQEEADLATWLGRVRLNRLGDASGAARALRRALALEPRHQGARGLLEQALSQSEQHAELAAFYLSELEQAPGSALRARAGVLLGQLHLGPLLDPAAATGAFRQALSKDPGLRPALRGLARAAVAQGAWGQFIEAYEQQLASCPDGEERAFLLQRMAEITEVEQQDRAGAARLYERLASQETKGLFADEDLLRLDETLGRWPELAAHLDGAARHGEPYVRLARLEQLAWVTETRLGLPAEALAGYQRMLEVEPTYLPALDGLGRLLARGDTAQTKLLARVLHDWQMAMGDTALGLRLGLRLARLQGFGQGRFRPAEALAARVLERASTSASGAHGDLFARLHAQAADTLLAMQHRGGTSEVLLEVLGRLPRPEPPLAQARFLVDLALRLERAGRDEEAAGLLEQAARLPMDWPLPLAELARIRAHKPEARKRHPLARIEADEGRGGGSASARLVLARLWTAFRTGSEPLGPESLLTSALALRPDDSLLSTLAELNLAWRLDIAGLAEQLRKRTGAWEPPRPGDPQGAHVGAGLLLAAGVLEQGLDDLPTAAALAQDTLRWLPGNRDALMVLERSHRASGDVAALAEDLRMLQDDVQSPLERASLLNALGCLYAQTHDLTQAGDCFRQAAEAVSGYLPAIRLWGRVCQAQGHPREVARALAMEAAASRLHDQRLTCTREAARLWLDEIGDLEQAAAAFRQLLRLNPGEPEAERTLAQILRQRGDWQQLIDLLLQEAARVPARRRWNQVAVAEIQRRHLKDPARARETLEQVLAQNPGDPEALEILRDLLRASEEWAALAQVDRQLLERTQDPARQAALLMELGRLEHRQLGQLAAATDAYRRLLALDPGHREALVELTALCEAQQDWPAARDLLTRLIEREPDRRKRMEHLLSLAHVRLEGFHDPTGAEETIRQVLRLDPGHLEATQRLIDLLSSRAGQDQALERHLSASLAVHRTRLERDPRLLDSYHALAILFRAGRDPDAQALVQEILAELQGASVPRPNTSAPPALARARRPITDEEINALVLHPDERGPFYRLLQAAAPALQPFAARDRAPASLPEPAAEAHPRVRRLLDDLCPSLGLPSVRVLSHPDLPGPRPGPGTEPSLLLPPGFEDRPLLEAAFDAGRALAALRLGHQPIAALGEDALGRLITTLLGLSCRTFSPPYPAAELAPLRRQLEPLLGKETLRRLASPCLELCDQSLDPRRWRAAMVHSEDRLALLCCGSPGAALRCLSREPEATLAPQVPGPEARARELLRFAISEPYLILRRELGLQISG